MLIFETCNPMEMKKTTQKNSQLKKYQGLNWEKYNKKRIQNKKKHKIKRIGIKFELKLNF